MDLSFFIHPIFQLDAYSRDIQGYKRDVLLMFFDGHTMDCNKALAGNGFRIFRATKLSSFGFRKVRRLHLFYYSSQKNRNKEG